MLLVSVVPFLKYSMVMYSLESMHELPDCLLQVLEETLKGNFHQILLSEMSLPGIEVRIEKLLTKILEIGDGEPI